MKGASSWGGIGSTRWAKARLIYHPNETDCEVVDTSELRHHGLFTESAHADIVVDWSIHHKRIQCRSFPGKVQLIYKVLGQAIRQNIEFVSIHVTLRSGLAMQYYLLCPSCLRQVRKLYRPFYTLPFGCRKCIRLRYKSQTMHHTNLLYALWREEKEDSYTIDRMYNLGRIRNRAIMDGKRHNMTYRGQPTRYWSKVHPRPIWKQAAYRALDWT